MRQNPRAENVTEKKTIAPSSAGGNDLAAIFNDDVGFIDFLFEIRRLPLVNMLPWPLLARNCLLRLKVSPLRRAAYSGGHVVIFAPCGPIQILRKNGSLLLWRRKISARELGPPDYRKIISISKPERAAPVSLRVKSDTMEDRTCLGHLTPAQLDAEQLQPRTDVGQGTAVRMPNNGTRE